MHFKATHTRLYWIKINKSKASSAAFILSYYNPWETVDGTLKSPSQDLSLRDKTVGTELTSRDTTQSLFHKEQLSLNSELAVVCSI